MFSIGDVECVIVIGKCILFRFIIICNCIIYLDIPAYIGIGILIEKKNCLLIVGL